MMRSRRRKRTFVQEIGLQSRIELYVMLSELGAAILLFGIGLHI